MNDPHSIPSYSHSRFSAYTLANDPETKVSEQRTSLEEPETTIGENVSINGQLKFESMLRIDGSFEGELLSEGKLIVGPKGHVKAEINLKEAYISGKVEGNITVSGRLVLRGHAEIIGNITAQSLSVDEGVSINGHLSIPSSSTE